MSAKQHSSGPNFLWAYSLPATGLSMFVDSLFIPTLIPAPTQLRIITPLSLNCLDPSSLCLIITITLHQIPSFVNWTLYSAPASSRWTCLKQKQNSLKHTDWSHFQFVCTDLNVTLRASRSHATFHSPALQDDPFIPSLSSSFQTSSIFLLPNRW